MNARRFLRPECDNFDALKKARASLRVARQYQQDWQSCGVERVYKHFDDVDGNWLEEWTESDDQNSDRCATLDSGRGLRMARH
jgi:hypothetical protein